MSRKSFISVDIPDGVIDRIRYYCIIEGPRDVVRFWCSGYGQEGVLLHFFDVIIDHSMHGKDALVESGRVYHTEALFTGYMVSIYPYTPYKLRDKV